MKLNKQTLGMLAALAGIWTIFALSTGGTFLSPRNLSLLARQMSVTGILASGMVLLIVAGQIDLSVGALTGLCGATAAVLCTNLGLPVPLGMAAALALGAVLGAAQGWLVADLEVPPFIVTLGGMLVFQGSLLGLTKGVSISLPQSFLLIGQNYLPPAAGWGLGALWAAYAVWQALKVPQARGRWAVLAALPLAVLAVFNAYEGLPLPVLWMLLSCFAFWVLAAHTPFGRQLYAIGGNREAAFYAGVPIRARLITGFTLMGLAAGGAGLVLAARVGAASSDAGHMMELDAIAAAVIGGTSLLGGRGSVWGAILGAAVMASLDNGMSLLNTEAFWQPILKGGILVSAVAVDLALRRRKA